IDARGKVQESLKQALANGHIELPDEFRPHHAQIADIIAKVAGRLEIKNADERRPVRPRQAILHSPEFKALWDRIKDKTTYRVEFDNEKLVEACIKALRDAPPLPKTRLQWRKADIVIGQGGVEATERGGAQTVVLAETDIALPAVLTQLQDRTQLTRRTICRVLTGSGRLDDFKRNPPAFIEPADAAIDGSKRLAIVYGIKYQGCADAYYYAQEPDALNGPPGYIRIMLTGTTKSVSESVVYDSGTEAAVADGLEKNEAVKVYAKP